MKVYEVESGESIIKNVNIDKHSCNGYGFHWPAGYVCHRMLGVCENAQKHLVDSFVLAHPLSLFSGMRIHIRFIALFLVAIAGAAAFRIYHDSIVEGETHTRARALFNVVLTLCIAIQRVAIRMRAYPYSSIILGLMILATSTPPMLGFTFLVTLSGFVYGFPQGVAPAMIGKSVCTFVSNEQWHSSRVHSLIGGYMGAMICFG